MSDECKHCTLRGDIKACEAVPCSLRENWWGLQKMAEIEKLKARLKDSHVVSPAEIKLIRQGGK